MLPANLEMRSETIYYTTIFNKNTNNLYEVQNNWKSGCLMLDRSHNTYTFKLMALVFPN